MMHPMRVVMRRTGLTPDVLRAWEKRYGAVDPHRSPGGHRMYSDEDLDRLVLLQRVTALGRGIGQVAKLPTHALRAVLMEDGSGLEASGSAHDGVIASEVYSDALARVEALDGPGLERMLRRGALLLGVNGLAEQVIVPLLGEMEDSSRRGESLPERERVAGHAVQRVIHWIGETLRETADVPRIILATTEGERQDHGIQLAAALASALRWHVDYLGCDLSTDSIVDATRQTGAEVLGLSFGSADAARKGREAVRTIFENLSPGVAVIASGAGAEELRGDLEAQGIAVLTTPGEIRAFLQSYR